MMNKSFMCITVCQVLLFGGLLLGHGDSAVADQVLSVPLNNAERLRLQGTAKDVIVANPAVADVTMLAPDQLVVIGKQAGRTTLLILDSKQRVLLNSMVVVSDGSGGFVTVHAPRGNRIGQDDYACAQNCTLIQDSNSSANAGGGGSSDTTNAVIPTETPPISKIDTKMKFKTTPNGVITGTRTDVPTYGVPPQ
jgi:hypothetical protein